VNVLTVDGQQWQEMETIRWTHPSVASLVSLGDPEQVIIDRARQAVFEAVEAGWEGPPYDPIILADRRGLRVSANPEVVDARTTLDPEGRLLVEFNPNQPRGRRRYSIAHEIAHTLFPDVADVVRHRTAAAERADDWQLEMLCNMAAAELLMPVGSLGVDFDSAPGIDAILGLRSTFDVSVEAITLRVVRLARSPTAAFVASTPKPGAAYRLDYFVPSTSWQMGIPASPGLDSVVRECVAIGYTAKATEHWQGVIDAVHVEAVAIPPYPGQRLPRVAGVVRPARDEESTGARIVHVNGNATNPRGTGPKVLVHVVNDRTPRWGGGFALEVGRRWPHIQKDFIDWVSDDPTGLQLGSVRIADAADGLRVASIVAQHGYGPSPRPRIRYGALEAGLESVGDHALEHGESIHAPRLGAGQAGGDWRIIEGLLAERLVARGIQVTIYTLPGAMPPAPRDGPTQLALGA
jgi:IrrE N-terminal-like domain